MFIAIVGTPSAGKLTVARYLSERHGFKRVRISGKLKSAANGHHVTGIDKGKCRDTEGISLMDLSLSPGTAPDGPGPQPSSSPSEAFSKEFPMLEVEEIQFEDPETALNAITRTWQEHYVTTDLDTVEALETGFLKRPFFLLVAVDGPVLTRYEREKRKHPSGLDLQTFIAQHDALLNGHPQPVHNASDVERPKETVKSRGHRAMPSLSSSTPADQPVVLEPASASSASAGGSVPVLRSVLSYAHLHILNNFQTVSDLHSHLDAVNLLNAERLRPGWDTYFMVGHVFADCARAVADVKAQTLASLASLRSNCMKRRVGALLVRSKRILSTGYNGTPRGLTNCNEGGCPRCNGEAKGGEARKSDRLLCVGFNRLRRTWSTILIHRSVNGCLCLHAEENALIEAGRERIGDDSVIYCNTCPCLTCSVKIVQAGVKEVVYNLNYSMDAASARVLGEGGVKLRQLVMPHTVT